jgi:hypothetical protein
MHTQATNSCRLSSICRQTMRPPAMRAVAPRFASRTAVPTCRSQRLERAGRAVGVKATSGEKTGELSAFNPKHMAALIDLVTPGYPGWLERSQVRRRRRRRLRRENMTRMACT